MEDVEEAPDVESTDLLNCVDDGKPRAMSRASTFSMFSSLSYRNLSQGGHRFSFILISCIAFFVTGMTIGALIVSLFVCNSEQHWMLESCLEGVMEYIYSAF